MKAARKRSAVLAAATLLAGFVTATAAPNSDAGIGDRLLARSVTHSNGKWVTVMQYTSERVTVTSSSGPASVATAPAVATRHIATANGTTKTVHSLSGEVTVPATSKATYNAAIRSRTARTVQPMSTSPLPGSDFNDTCVDVSFDMGDHSNYMGHLHGCDQQRIIRRVTSTNWYMYDRWQASASMHDYSIINPDELTGVLFGIHYGSYNVIQDWAPLYSHNTGTCYTMHNTVTVGPQDAQYSVGLDQPVCPASEGLYSISNTTMKTKWNGNGSGPSDGSRATYGHAAVHSPSGAVATRGLPYTVWYE